VFKLSCPHLTGIALHSSPYRGALAGLADMEAGRRRIDFGALWVCRIAILKMGSTRVETFLNLYKDRGTRDRIRKYEIRKIMAI